MRLFTHKCRFCGVPIHEDGKRWNTWNTWDTADSIFQAWSDGSMCTCAGTLRWHKPPEPVPVDVAIQELLEIAGSA